MFDFFSTILDYVKTFFEFIFAPINFLFNIIGVASRGIALATVFVTNVVPDFLQVPLKIFIYSIPVMFILGVVRRIL